MIALLADEDFNGRIIRGLRRRVHDANLVTVNEAGLAGQVDPMVISWAAVNNRVLLTHDVNTMIDAALDRVRKAQPMPGGGRRPAAHRHRRGDLGSGSDRDVR